MSWVRILFASVLCFSSVVGAAESSSPVEKAHDDLTTQILAELRVAPGELVDGFLADEVKLKQFISGRLQDMAIADYARKLGLEREPSVMARRIVEERSDLVRAAVANYQEDERKKLPDLEQLARQRYLATRQQFAIPEQIRVAHILLRADVETMSDEEIAAQRTRALQVKARLSAGEDFASLARELSEERATAENGGELPRLVAKGQFVPPFDSAAWALGEGEVSDIVRTRFGFHIIKLIARKPATYKPYEEVRGELLSTVENEILAPRRSAFVDSFRGKAIDAKAALILPEVHEALKALHASAPEKLPSTAPVPAK